MTSPPNQDQPKIIQTDKNAKDGQDKCPKCGSSDISQLKQTDSLRCNYCRAEFAPKKIDLEQVDNLSEKVVASGALDIKSKQNQVVTLSCESCGAEVVINLAEVAQARCHWCRNTLSINRQMENGLIPDGLLPFSLEKATAEQKIQSFVKKRRFYAHPKFRKEFTTENIMGVYFPYMAVDARLKVSLKGEGEHLISSYKVGENTRLYDADRYVVEREFDLSLEGLTIESSSTRRDKTKGRTENIINAIMPFDTENCVHYNANYLKGFSSEKRDLNISALEGMAEKQTHDVARFAANSSLSFYDRGVRWDEQNIKILGQQWKAVYLPVWLYSYQQKRKKGDILHYVAVNARTVETMGSVPINYFKLVVVSILVEILGILALIFAEDFDDGWIFLTAGFVYFGIIKLKYRNKNARHLHETETKNQISNLKQKDLLLRRITGMSNSRMERANNQSVEGSFF